MSKHSNSEAKLHLPQQLRGLAAAVPKQPASIKDNKAPQIPAKGTNANNQYR